MHQKGTERTRRQFGAASLFRPFFYRRENRKRRARMLLSTTERGIRSSVKLNFRLFVPKRNGDLTENSNAQARTAWCSLLLCLFICCWRD